MLTIYNNKEYKFFSQPGGWILLLSSEPVDDTWTKCESNNGYIYKKMVRESECEKFYVINCYGCYKGQKIEIIDIENDKVMVIGDSDNHTQEFIDLIFRGKKGRELRKWCDISVFSSFDIRYFYDYEHIEVANNVTIEQVREKVKKMFCLC